MSDPRQGGADVPPPLESAPSLAEEWDEVSQENMAAALAKAREDAMEPEAPPSPEQAARDWSTAVTSNRLAEKIESGVPLAKAEREAMSVREMDHEPDLAAAGVLANGETVTAEDLEGMPWYEARVEVYVRADPPGDEYGEGGDKIAHTRATTQAPNFTAAAPRLDAELGTKWQQLLQMAPLADQAPTPRQAPVPEQPAPPPRFPTLIVVAALVPYLLLLLAILLTR